MSKMNVQQSIPEAPSNSGYLESFGAEEVPKGWILGSVLGSHFVKIDTEIDAQIEILKTDPNGSDIIH